ncbi:MAG: NifB/NifX family molybdenum-iron cluster-binding protein [Oscillospiraceae bacterium]
MTIAIPCENGQVFQHFGKTEQFKLYTAENGQITGVRLLGTGGNGHGALASFLRQNGANAVVCGGLGEGARQALSAAGIAVYGGVSGSADAAAESLFAGRLVFNPNAACGHAHHAEGEGQAHSCGHGQHAEGEEQAHSCGHGQHAEGEEQAHSCGHGHHAEGEGQAHSCGYAHHAGEKSTPKG